MKVDKLLATNNFNHYSYKELGIGIINKYKMLIILVKYKIYR
jgi:hypothetical protein